MIPTAHARRLMPITMVLLGVLAVLPIRYLGWAHGFGQLSRTVVAPVSNPLAMLSRWLSPPTRAAPDSEELRALRDEREASRVQMLQALGENDRLRLLIKELQRGHALDPEMAVQQLEAVTVLGSATDLRDGLLTVRAGTAQGVDLHTVATAMGLQLLGRVISVGARTCTVAPITSKASGTLRAMVMLDDTANGLGCTLVPVGDGSLSGDVEDRRGGAGAASIEPIVGQEVRLNDPAQWARSAQMLLIGTVVRVEPSPKQPLRKVITVRPTIENLDRVSEVVLRIMPDAEGAGPGRATPAGGRP